jgi:hypothetical protein
VEAFVIIAIVIAIVAAVGYFNAEAATRRARATRAACRSRSTMAPAAR